MAALGTIPNTTEINGSALGTTPNTTSIGDAALGATLSTTDIDTGAPSPAQFIHGTYAKTSGGSEHYLIAIPEGVDDNTDDYPVFFWYHGDGADGVFTTITDQATTGSGTSRSGNFVNSGVAKVLYSSVVVREDGVEVASGRANGTIIGDGVSGTMAHNTAGGAFALTFNESPSGTITIDYMYSFLLRESTPLFSNEGKLLEKMYVVMIQKEADDVPFDEDDHYVDIRDVIIANYRVDTNRIYVGGLSRGAFFAKDLLLSRYNEIAAFIMAAGVLGSGHTWTNYTDRGHMWVSGSIDGTATPPQSSILNGCGAVSLNFYPYCKVIPGAGHTDAVWDDECFDREVSPVDWLKWSQKWSLDQDQRSELFVEFAEDSLKIEDWKEAVRVVALLSAGSLKTELEGRLATLKTSIMGTRRRWIVDFGNTSSSMTGVNTMTNCNTGQSLSNLVDEDGDASTIGIEIPSQMGSTNTNRISNQQRCANPLYGYGQNEYRDGATLTEGVTTGGITWTGLDTGKTYTLKLHHMHGSTSGVTNPAYCEAVCDSETIEQYSESTNVNYIEFNEKAPDGSGELTCVVRAGGASNSILQIAVLEEES